MADRKAKQARKAQQAEAPHKGLAALARLLARDLARRDLEKGLSPESSGAYQMKATGTRSVFASGKSCPRPKA
jgi:hypothetical protein